MVDQSVPNLAGSDRPPIAKEELQSKSVLDREPAFLSDNSFYKALMIGLILIAGFCVVGALILAFCDKEIPDKISTVPIIIITGLVAIFSQRNQA